MRGWQPLQAVMLQTLLDRAQARVDQRRDQCEALRRAEPRLLCVDHAALQFADQAFQLHVRVTAEASAQRHEAGLQAWCATALVRGKHAQTSQARHILQRTAA